MAKDGTKNLKPQSMRTKDEQRAIATKGGIASGVARRKRKTMAEAIKLALEQDINGESVQDIGIMALLKKYMDGNVKVHEYVRDTIGEKPTDKTALDASVSMSDADRELLAKVAGRLKSE